MSFADVDTTWYGMFNNYVCVLVLCIAYSYIAILLFSHIFPWGVLMCLWILWLWCVPSFQCLNVCYFPGSLAAQQVTFSIAEVGVKIVASYFDMHGTGAAFPCHKQAGVQVSFQHDPCGHVNDQVAVFFGMWSTDLCDLWKHSKLVAFHKGYSSCPGTNKNHLFSHILTWGPY